MAWSWVPREHKPGEVYEPFKCEMICGPKRWNEQQRATYNCSRFDLPKPTAKPKKGARLPVYMGGPKDDFDRPIPESLKDGCPGGWYRNPFAWSVQRYLRKRSGDGLRSEALFKTDDPLILEALDLFEQYQDANARHQITLMRKN